MKIHLAGKGKRLRKAGFGLGLICAAATLTAVPCKSAADHTLPETFAKIDEAAARFKSLSANVERVQHMDAIHEDDTDNGTVLVRRPKPKDLRVRFEYQKPEPRIVVTDGHNVDVYYPRSGQIDKMEVGRRRTLLDMMLALGFGGTSRDLQNLYQVKMGGEDTVGGESATRLELIPKSPDMLTQAKRIDLWVSNKSGSTLQQKFYESGRDYDLLTYTNVKINPDIPDSAFKLEVPKGTKRETVIKK